MSTPLAGRVVVITGGARGIGYATAKHLISQGAKVAIGDIDEAQLKTAADDLGTVAHKRLDVTDADSFKEFFDFVETQAGPVDVLINNAGIMPVGLVIDEDETIVRRMFEINVFGVITGTKIALRSMLPRGAGQIINIASLAGEMTFPGLASYCGTKHAVLGFSDSVRKEVRSSGVTVSCILPTITNTQLASGAKGIRGIRTAEPEEIAAAIARVIEKPVPRTRVTGLAGSLVRAQHFFPHGLYERIGRFLGADTQFVTDLDVTARRDYEDRARHS
ncbi:SDR family oxidoreductase [Hoyosella subflava]|uniref:Putative oxidoreductase n=1 Tax=Hoyosella subflava (strain DSM 45089 / JCM 17490 / NBRC 109087 / DQS3-9A1) TaxID=443218 RepID=F6EGK2_HOYSD|nr:SDR family oxidoreductase [Hoyosella subflava]AEF41055.1 Putative oxidoreductase [Hoyosella subflava DQS3-9A1]